jgi:hypothetical protein
LPIAELAKQLFGDDGAQAVAARIESATPLGSDPLPGMLFPEMAATPTVRERGASDHGNGKGVDISDASLTTAREATTLDRGHAAMLLQAVGADGCRGQPKSGSSLIANSGETGRFRWHEHNTAGFGRSPAG